MPIHGDSAPETIVAIATPPGRSGLGVVRLSGAAARSIAEGMLRLRHPFAPAQARLAEILEPASQNPANHDPANQDGRPRATLDEAMATYFAAPHSYTGEDVVEIAAHGSPVILEALVEYALAAGARLANPGEFTERAFLSGRIDLTQAEAVRDLIEAQTLYQAQVAARQLGGALSRRIKPVKEQLIDLIALLEAGIDFAEDDIDVAPASAIRGRLAAARAALAPVAASFRHGRIVHSGLTLAIVGRPNAGKSSLFNRLVERERAIVTAAPGTTRDPVTERVALGGIPVELVDTAGLREPRDEAEQIGIQKSREALADADMALLVLDATERLLPEELELLSALADRPAIVVENKVDLPRALPSQASTMTSTLLPVMRTSALTGDGIPELKARMLAMVCGSHGEGESGMLTNARQAHAVTAAVEALSTAEQAVADQVPHEMLLLDLYEALRQLDSLTGETTGDDILNLIFSTFCIGK